METDDNVNAAGSNTTNESEICNVTSFENISYFLAHHRYPSGLNLNQKRTLRKAAANFCLIGGKLYYTGKNKKEKRLVILDDEGKQRVFGDCHDSVAGGHWGQKKTLEKIESLFFWRGMVKDIVSWIQACEFCQQKEEKRSIPAKKLKLNHTISETSTVDLNVIDGENSTLISLLETSKRNIEQLQNLIQHVQETEQHIMSMAKRAERDIDDVLDAFLSQIIKTISTKKREMKEQVDAHKNKAMLPLHQSRKQLETKLKAAKKLVIDLETTLNDSQKWTPLMNKASLINSLPDIPRKEDIGGVWTLFTLELAQEEVKKIIQSCGNVTDRPPFCISNVLQLPASLRLSFELDKRNDPDKKKDIRDKYNSPKKLRICYRKSQVTNTNDYFVDDGQGQIITVNFNAPEVDCCLSNLEPHQIYAVYLSHFEEGASDWSPWSYPFFSSTNIPPYSWDSSNVAWLISGKNDIATKLISSSTPLYSSSAQFFPGCKISFTIIDMTATVSDDGFALVEQWVQGGTLCQEGTVFVNTSGQLFIDGKFYSHLFGPLKPGVPLFFDCYPRVENSNEGLRLRFTLSYQNKSQFIYWNMRSQISNVYFGAQFSNQGTRIRID